MKNITSKQISLIGIIGCTLWFLVGAFSSAEIIFALSGDDSFSLDSFTLFHAQYLIDSVTRILLILALLTVVVMEYTQKYNKDVLLLCLIFAFLGVIFPIISTMIGWYGYFVGYSLISIVQSLAFNGSVFIYILFYYRNGQRSTIKEISYMQQATVIAIIGITLQFILFIIANFYTILLKFSDKYSLVTSSNLITLTLITVLLLTYFALNFSYYKSEIRKYY